MSIARALSRFALVAALALAIAALGAACDDDEDAGTDGDATATEEIPTDAPDTDEPPATMELSSSAFDQNDSIPTVYTCDGANTSPPLTIAGVPDGAAALALIVDDPDAPSGSFVHWTVWNIDPTTAEAPDGTVPGGGIEGLNGGGALGYTGPCPPTGAHRYIFTLYALDAELTLDAATTGRDELVAAMDEHILATGQLVGMYARTGPTTG